MFTSTFSKFSRLRNVKPDGKCFILDQFGMPELWSVHMPQPSAKYFSIQPFHSVNKCTKGQIHEPSIILFWKTGLQWWNSTLTERYHSFGEDSLCSLVCFLPFSHQEWIEWWRSCPFLEPPYAPHPVDWWSWSTESQSESPLPGGQPKNGRDNDFDDRVKIDI